MRPLYRRRRRGPREKPAQLRDFPRRRGRAEHSAALRTRRLAKGARQCRRWHVACRLRPSGRLHASIRLRRDAVPGRGTHRRGPRAGTRPEPLRRLPLRQPQDRCRPPTFPIGTPRRTPAGGSAATAATAAIRSPSNRSSPIAKSSPAPTRPARSTAVTCPRTCGTCHTGPFVQFQKSKHYELLRAGDRDVPTCTTCHGEAAGVRLSPKALESQCAQCHGARKIAPHTEFPAEGRLALEGLRETRALLRDARSAIARVKDSGAAGVARGAGAAGRGADHRGDPGRPSVRVHATRRAAAGGADAPDGAVRPSRQPLSASGRGRLSAPVRA